MKNEQLELIQGSQKVHNKLKSAYISVYKARDDYVGRTCLGVNQVRSQRKCVVFAFVTTNFVGEIFAFLKVIRLPLLIQFGRIIYLFNKYIFKRK